MTPNLRYLASKICLLLSLTPYPRTNTIAQPLIRALRLQFKDLSKTTGKLVWNTRNPKRKHKKSDLMQNRESVNGKKWQRNMKLG